jgi:hypothetical protein
MVAAAAGAAPRDYAAACAALASLIGTHYRPTGHDAATTFKQLGLWVQARGSAPSTHTHTLLSAESRG